MIESSFIESVISSVFDLIDIEVLTGPSDRALFDFIIKDAEGKKTGIEIKGQHVTRKNIYDISAELKKHPDLVDFLLITPEEPASPMEEWTREVFKESKVEFRWLSISQYIEILDLGIEPAGDIRNTLLDLQLASITSKFEDYRRKSDPSEKKAEILKSNLKRNFLRIQEEKAGKKSLLFGFRRQFPFSIISELEKDPDQIEENLGFGKRKEDTIIILTDIKSFSSLVSVADDAELNYLMSKYYLNARELVFKYGGILDKFIGDGVLAIFNYPFKRDESFSNAIKFSAELILLGESILQGFQRKLDHKIKTGTRVGIATGSIYSLNIGAGEYEITFLGDKINLAARLEKKCDVNGILMSNRFYHKLIDYDTEFDGRLKIEQTVIDPKDAKGQMESITAWQIQRNQLEMIV